MKRRNKSALLLVYLIFKGLNRFFRSGQYRQNSPANESKTIMAAHTTEFECDNMRCMTKRIDALLRQTH